MAYSGEGKLIEAVDPLGTIIPLICDINGELLVDATISGTLPPITGTVAVSNFPATQNVSGTVTANAGSGTFNENLTEVGGAAITLGQAVSAASIPVVIASDQSPIPVVGSISTSPNVNVHDGSGNTISSTGTSLNVDVTNTVPVSGTVAVSNFPSTQNVSVVTALPAGSNVIGHVIADSGSTTVVTGSVTVVQPTGTNLHTVIDSGTVTISGTSPISGTVTANQGTAAALAAAWPVELSDGTNLLGTAAHPVRIDPTGTTQQTVNGTVAISTVGAGTNLIGSVNAIPTDGTKATYSASVTGLVVASPAQIIWSMFGSATKVARVLQILVSATQTTASETDIVLRKLSSVNTGGTSTSPNLVPHDSNNAASGASVFAYTVNPTGGATLGQVRTQKQYVGSVTTGSSTQITWNFAGQPAQAIVLRNANEGVAISLQGATLAGGSYDITVEWTEE